jgi:beta-phosphoglucomutase
MPTAPGRAAIWDLDGVIIDSAEQHWRSWQQLAVETHTTFTEADFRRTFGMRNADIIPRYWRIQSAADIKRLADRKEAIYRDLLRSSAWPLPGALDLLHALHDAAWHQALASSAPMDNIQLVLDLLDLRTLLDAVVSGEEAPNGKPAPDIFLAAARALNIGPMHCVVFEDAVAGVQAAHAAGMRCIAVTNGRPSGELEIADRVVATLAEIAVGTVAALAS